MTLAESMRFAGIVQRRLFPQERRFAVSHTPGTEHFHNRAPFMFCSFIDVEWRKSRAIHSFQRKSAIVQHDNTFDRI